MLNFRNSNIFFSLALIVLISLHLRYGLPFYAYVLLAVCYSLLLFWGSYFVGSNFYFKIICSAETTEKQIAITFDDGPLPDYTAQVLKILQEMDVPAAFFCIGHRVLKYPELVRQVIHQGHLVGNHSYSHDLWFDLFSANKMCNDLELMDQALVGIAGIKPNLFRPPYGVTNPNLRKAVIKGNYIPVGWNIRSFDTVIKDPQKLLQKVTSLLKPGAVILFHDTMKVTPGMLSAFITQARKEGYEIVRLDKLLKLKPYV